MKEILEYQKLDIELRRVKKSSSENLDTNNINKLKSYILEASEKGKTLENRHQNYIRLSHIQPSRNYL